MILADTSVWIKALSRKPPFEEELTDLLIRGQIAGHDLVFGELLIRDKGGGDKGGRAKALEVYERMDQAPVVPHDAVVQLVHIRKLHGQGVGWIDVHLLASAILADAIGLWTRDRRLALVAGGTEEHLHDGERAAIY